MKKICLAVIVAVVGLIGASLLYINFRTVPQQNDEWPDKAVHVEIASTMDDHLQEAYFISSSNESPLIVSLHQWSASFKHFDPIIEMAMQEDWNYIRPNFRGPNTNPQAGGSEFVVSDIDDAITFALEHGNVDESRIHIIGASGGGHAALQHLMVSQNPANNYSVWVPITDLVAWYGQSFLRETNYDQDILAITDSSDGHLDIDEARRRSPMYQETSDKISEVNLDIFAGVRDGYDGSVPISHSIDFFNKLVRELDYGEENEIPFEIRNELLYAQTVYEEYEQQLGERDVIFQSIVENLSLTIFDGDHEILYSEAFLLSVEYDYLIDN